MVRQAHHEKHHVFRESLPKLVRRVNTRMGLISGRIPEIREQRGHLARLVEL